MSLLAFVRGISDLVARSTVRARGAGYPTARMPPVIGPGWGLGLALW
jgi:hypothetical protein